MPDEGLPIELRRLWGLSEASRIGRPAELDVEKVVRAAVQLADRHGLARVTLPRIAKSLGFTAMSLYRYVGSKAELLTLMQNFAIGPAPEISSAPSAWREGLRQWACAERELNHRRPWLARLPISRPPSGPNQIAWIEAGLRGLRGTGLDWAEKVGVLILISGYVRQASLLSEDLERGRAGTGLGRAQAEQRYGRNLMKLVDPQRFPECARLFASGVFAASPAENADTPTADPDFTFGLERILDGVAAAVARRRKRR
jgi:AcrR family transcriptional regulator